MTADLPNNKPSRSEIENAVSGKTPARKPSQTKRRTNRQNASARLGSHSELQLDSQHSRRRQVIGGDLTGISRRGSKKGIWSRVTGMNFVNWIAVSIVVAILAVFFWPQGHSSGTREITLPDQENFAGGYQGEERADEVEAAVESGSFSREDDIERATEFRLEDNQLRQINMLLEAAKQHVAAGEYSLPPGDNAISKFQQVLQIDSSNVDAKQGISFISSRFLNAGSQALQEGDVDKARQILTKLREIDANSDESLELTNAISAYATKQQTEEFLAQAQTAKSADQLILPARQNALYFYQQVLELEPGNETALGGIQTIADEFVNKANQAVLSGDLQAATGYLATVSVIDPEHPSVPLVESMIANAKPIASAANQDPVATRGVANSAENQSQNQANAAETQENPSSIQSVPTSLPRKPSQVSSNRTPSSVAREREEFDRRYLQRGLDAYYRGDYDEAAALLQPLADKGVSRAQFRIAYMYYLGRGFERDRAKADEMIRTALPAVQKFADEGRGWAQSDIGSLYEDGLVLPRDYAEAIYWYRSAAEQGYPGAQTNLGVMYARGLGVSTSRKTAIEWFQRAAKQGDIAAIRNLEAMGISP